ncbi:MAG TPA: MBG domain-containing protein [Granulicella sp.]|nr:MBG domain-containing protein [Granulicella sp.]
MGSGFSYPSGVAVDGAGDVFVTDFGNSAVKEIVAVHGVVSSSSQVNIVGSGFSSPVGVAVDGAGDVFVADTGNNAVKEIVAVNGAVSSSSQVNIVGSGFASPSGVAVDGAGDVFVADFGNSAVKEIVAVYGPLSSSSPIIIVGSDFSIPQGVAVDGSGDVFVTYFGGNSAPVKEIVAVNGVVSSSSQVNIVGSGFNNPAGVAVDGAGDVFVADQLNNTVDEVLNGVNFGSAGVATTTPTQLAPSFTFTAAGTMGAPVVLTQGAPGKDFTDAGTGSCTTNGISYSYPAGATCFVNVNFTPTKPGQRLGAVQLLSNGGMVIATANLYGTGTGPMVTFPGNSTVNTLGSGFANPYGVAVDGSGDVFVADFGSNAVKEIVAVNGVVSSSSQVNIVASGFSIIPQGVAVDGSGDVFVTYFGNNVVKEIVAVHGVVSSSSQVNIVGSGFTYPVGVAVDGAGNVFVADTGNNAVKEIVAVHGVVSSSSQVNIVGSGFTYPVGVAVDGAGDVFVADRGNNAVKEIVAANGAVSSSSQVNIVGSGFSIPQGVAVDGSGDVFVPDEGNSAVKELPLSTPPALAFPSTSVGASRSAQSVTIANTGNASLMIPPPTMGTNPSIAAGFQYDNTSTCPQLSTSSSGDTLNPGASCTLAIDFVPITGGSISGSLVLTDNALNAAAPNYTQQTIALSGTAVQITLTPGTLPGGSYGTAYSQTVTAAGGTAPYTYALFSGTLPPGLALNTGTGVLSGTPTAAGTFSFAITATDANGFTGTQSYTLTISPAALTITANNATRAYGTANPTFTGIYAGAVNGDTFTVAGTTTATTTSPVGTYSIVPTVTGANLANYTVTIVNGTLTVSQATPAITWATPAAVAYGTALSATQLNATASVAGTFTYSPAAGTVLHAGSQTLTATFTPTDTTDYTTATSAVTLTVSQATPAITWATPAAVAYGTTLSETQLNATASVAGTFIYSPAAGTVLHAGSQTLTATFTSTDTTDYTTATSTVTLTVNAQTTPVVPTLTFAPIATQVEGAAPFAVTATSASSGAVTYAVTSGPATIAGNMVTVAAAGTVVLTATQAASGNYAAATATISFTVGAPFTLTTPTGSTAGSAGTTASVAPGAAASFTLTLAPAGATTFPDAITFSVTGLPPGATATFSPAMIPANSPVTPLSMTIQTSNSQTNSPTAHNEQPSSGLPLAPVALGFLLLPLAGLKRLKRMPRLFVALFVAALSLTSVLGLSGCGGGNGFFNQAAQTYTVKVIATDMKTSAAASTNVTLTVQ